MVAKRKKRSPGKGKISRKNVPPHKKPSQNKEDIKLIGVSFNVSLFDDKKEEKEEDSNIVLINDLVRNGRDFTTILQMLWKYINSIGLLAETTSNTSIGTLIVLLDEIKHIAKNRTDQPLAELEIELLGKDKNDNEKINKQKVKIYDPSHFVKIMEFKQHNQAALSILHDTAIQQLVNAWEKLLADILLWYYKNNHDKITKNKSISYDKILQFSNLDEAKQEVIDQEIKEFLKDNASEQIKSLNKIFGINFQSSFQKTDFLHELIFTRHLIVHYGSITTSEYLNKISKLKLKKLEPQDVGKKIVITPDYIISTWGVIYTAGVMLIHLIAKKTHFPAHKIYDDFINNSAFKNIQKNQLDSAITLLEYAKDRGIQDTKASWTMKLNLAQAYKWNGEQEKCDELLNSSEWDIANVLFELCVASLRNCPEEFASHMKEACNKGKINITELYEWPIFHTMREHDDFDKWVEDAFGYKLNKYRGLINQKVLDYKPDLTAKMLTEYFDGKG